MGPGALALRAPLGDAAISATLSGGLGSGAVAIQVDAPWQGDASPVGCHGGRYGERDMSAEGRPAHAGGPFGPFHWQDAR